MSRQNKVNPGMYTQRGRLTQDDAARELKRQREIGSQHTWQPVKKDQRPRPTAADEDSVSATETTEDTGELEQQPKAAGRKTVKAKAAKAQPAATKKSAKTAAKGPVKKRATSSKTAAKRTAVLARNTGGGRPKPRAAAKSRKS